MVFEPKYNRAAEALALALALNAKISKGEAVSPDASSVMLKHFTVADNQCQQVFGCKLENLDSETLGDLVRLGIRLTSKQA